MVVHEAEKASGRTRIQHTRLSLGNWHCKRFTEFSLPSELMRSRDIYVFPCSYFSRQSEKSHIINLNCLSENCWFIPIYYAIRGYQYQSRSSHLISQLSSSTSNMLVSSTLTTVRKLYNLKKHNGFILFHEWSTNVKKGTNSPVIFITRNQTTPKHSYL